MFGGSAEPSKRRIRVVSIVQGKQATRMTGTRMVVRRESERVEHTRRIGPLHATCVGQCVRRPVVTAECEIDETVFQIDLEAMSSARPAAVGSDECLAGGLQTHRRLGWGHADRRLERTQSAQRDEMLGLAVVRADRLQGFTQGDPCALAKLETRQRALRVVPHNAMQ